MYIELYILWVTPYDFKEKEFKNPNVYLSFKVSSLTKNYWETNRKILQKK